MSIVETLKYVLRPAERRILKKRDKLPPSLWSEGVPGKHKPQRYIRRGAKSGPWQNKNNPVGALIMDLFALAHVRVGVVGKGSQTGISDAVYSFLGRRLTIQLGRMPPWLSWPMRRASKSTARIGLLKCWKIPPV